jgi:peptidoglycan hydrolase-like protein with peptidoglycan-binding domain
VAQGYVVGTGTLTDDFGDEGPLSTSQNSHNSVVGLWQAILVADGYLGRSDLECYFGPVTRDATMRWQADRGLDADGIVGPQTFGRADDNLYWVGDEIRYNGTVQDLYNMHRLSNGRYYVQSSEGRVGISYNHANMCG